MTPEAFNPGSPPEIPRPAPLRLAEGARSRFRIALENPQLPHKGPASRNPFHAFGPDALRPPPDGLVRSLASRP